MTLAPWLRLARFGLLAACTYTWLLVHGCGPGPGYGSRPRQRRLTPLAYRQYVPSISENNLGASGRAEGKIARNSERFNELVCNYNPDIDFKDEERTEADRFMTKRCKDCLNKLSIAVMNQWPGVRLRVTEAWDEDDNHPPGSLHYEGRAVDITTSDRDIKKYGLLAQLAVEAGFDWVYYESKHHVHCSVKADHSVAVEKGGCFSASGVVTLAGGLHKPMSCLCPGDAVLALSELGERVFSRVLLFLHLDPESRSNFLILGTEDGQHLALTPNHLIFVASNSKLHHNEYHAGFASRVKMGDYVLISERDGGVRPSRIVSVSQEERIGVYAPLTEHGNLFVDGVLASSYASIEDHGLAHWALGPLRFLFGLVQLFVDENSETTNKQYGVRVHRACITCPIPSGGYINVKHNISGVYSTINKINNTSLNKRAFKQYFDCMDGSQVGVYWYARILHTFGQMFLNPQKFY
ncbi:desert hedgehog protein [Brachyhypopomus gauderio]|uniref:desert hedgehog protein n=1 Tax=Brachyhypopomus gauderio TaxID=698409 RepID=UPI0040436155